MNLQLLLSLDVPVEVNDWFLTVMTVSFLAMLFIMGPYREFYFKGFFSMYRFKSMDSDICYPPYTPLGYISVTVFSCISMGLAFAVAVCNMLETDMPVLTATLVGSGIFGLFFLIRILLYQTVNNSLYKSQKTTLKTIRWNGFYIMVFSAAGMISVVLGIVSLFMGIPGKAMFISGFVVLVFTEIGLFYMIKTALFRNKCTLLGFILYLCALQIMPIVLMLVLLGKSIS